MKKNLFILGTLILIISGCATPGFVGVFKDKYILTDIFNKHNDWPAETKDNFIKGFLQLGMTKGQVLYLQGSPNNWSKYNINDATYESWSWPMSIAKYSTCDFKNGLLVGYSERGKYYSPDGVDDVRKY